MLENCSKHSTRFIWQTNFLMRSLEQFTSLPFLLTTLRDVPASLPPDESVSNRMEFFDKFF